MTHTTDWQHITEARIKLMVLTGVFSGILALVLSGYLDNKLHIVVATVVATTLACFIEGNDEEVE